MMSDGIQMGQDSEPRRPSALPGEGEMSHTKTPKSDGSGQNASQLTPMKQPPRVGFGSFARDGGCGDGLEMAMTMGLCGNGAMKRMPWTGGIAASVEGQD